MGGGVSGGRGGNPYNPNGNLPLPGSEEFFGGSPRGPVIPEVAGAPMNEGVIKASIAEQEGQAPKPIADNPARLSADPAPDNSNNVTRDAARARQQGLAAQATPRRSTLLGGLLGLSDAGLTSARKTLLGV